MAEKLIVQGNKVVAVSVYGVGNRVFRLDFQCVDSEFNYDIGPIGSVTASRGQSLVNGQRIEVSDGMSIQSGRSGADNRLSLRQNG